MHVIIIIYYYYYYYELSLSYMTASKVILLARGLHKLTANCQRAAAAGNLRDPVRVLVDSISTQMAHRFHKIESHVLLSEAAALDPRFKKKAFQQDEDADGAYQRLCNVAARVTFPNQQAEGEEEGVPHRRVPSGETSMSRSLGL